MSGPLKKTTGLTGLAVSSNAHKSLQTIYRKLLETLERMPSNAAYRSTTQLIIQDRLNHVKSEPSIPKLERKINSGQIEEVILQAERELHLARMMLEWKPWEPLIDEAPKNQWVWPPT